MEIPLLSSFSWTCTLHPIEARGILLKLNSPHKYAEAEILGFALACRSRFNVILACGSRQSQSASGKSSSVPANMLRKCAWKFLIATSAALCRAPFKLKEVRRPFVTFALRQPHDIWCQQSLPNLLRICKEQETYSSPWNNVTHRVYPRVMRCSPQQRPTLFNPDNSMI